MGRRRRGMQEQQTQPVSNGTMNEQLRAQQGYENAVEPTHNGNYAWNGQPIPNYQPNSQGTQGNQMNQSNQSNQTNLMNQGNGSAYQHGQRNTGIKNADARSVGFQGGYTGYGANGQPIQYCTFMRDGTQYGKGPHTIDPNKAIISGVRYADGGINAVQFQDGTTADIAQAIGMAEAGLIEDVNTGRNREGQKTLRSYPDGDPSNNLSNLPRF